jgi:hypothetical protein
MQYKIFIALSTQAWMGDTSTILDVLTVEICALIS